MSAFTGELIGTALLILLGDGVVANVLLKNTKGHASGWIVITFGWAMAVFVGVLVASSASGAHLNPAVSVGLAVAGKFDWGLLPVYVAAQMLGACGGAAIVWLQYKAHFRATEDRDAKLGVFCTGPAIRSAGWDDGVSARGETSRTALSASPRASACSAGARGGAGSALRVWASGRGAQQFRNRRRQVNRGSSQRRQHDLRRHGKRRDLEDGRRRSDLEAGLLQ